MDPRGKRHDLGARSGTTVGALIAAGVRALAGVSSSPLLDSQVLLAYATALPRSSILAFPEAPVHAPAAERFARMVARRARGEPIAYLVRVQEFFSLPLRVTPAVLIPRPETELLVEEALAQCTRAVRRTVLDLATGSGAIACALKRERPELEITASDVSAAALAVARANAERLGLLLRFVESDWLAALAGERFDLIVCNPPYVASGDRAFADLAFEPRLALDGGADGLDSLRVVLATARIHLNDGGLLLLEHGHDQRAALTQLSAANGWKVLAAHADLAGHARALVLAADSAA
jgi:release factor glutamine methyltransferase